MNLCSKVLCYGEFSYVRAASLIRLQVFLVGTFLFGCFNRKFTNQIGLAYISSCKYNWKLN